jgi:hypothetical protein
MPTFRPRFRDGQTEDVEGDDASTFPSGNVCVVLDVLVYGQPRRVIARRVLAADGVVAVERL